MKLAEMKEPFTPPTPSDFPLPCFLPLRGRILFYFTAWQEGISQVRMLFCCSNQINLLGKALWFGYSSISKEPYSLTLNFLLESHEPGIQFNHLAGPPCFLCFRAMPLLNFLKPCPYHQQPDSGKSFFLFFTNSG